MRLTKNLEGINLPHYVSEAVSQKSVFKNSPLYSVYRQFCSVDLQLLYCLLNSDTLQVLIFILRLVLELRFYEWCCLTSFWSVKKDYLKSISVNAYLRKRICQKMSILEKAYIRKRLSQKTHMSENAYLRKRLSQKTTQGWIYYTLLGSSHKKSILKKAAFSIFNFKNFCIKSSFFKSLSNKTGINFLICILIFVGKCL